MAYVDEDVEAEIVGVFKGGVDGPEDEVGVDLDEVIVAKILDKAVADEGVGFEDEDAVLVGLRSGWVVVV